MSELKRYTPSGAPGFPGPAAMYPDDHGSWVEIHDYAILHAEYATLRARLDKLERVKEAAYKFHHRYCAGNDEHEHAIRWRDLDAALADLDKQEEPT